MKPPYAIDRDHYRKAQAIACRAMEPGAMDTSTKPPPGKAGGTLRKSTWKDCKSQGVTVF